MTFGRRRTSVRHAVVKGTIVCGAKLTAEQCRKRIAKDVADANCEKCLRVVRMAKKEIKQ